MLGNDDTQNQPVYHELLRSEIEHCKVCQDCRELRPGTSTLCDFRLKIGAQTLVSIFGKHERNGHSPRD